MQALIIEAVAEGGYFVRELPSSAHAYAPPLLACTTLNEALAFARAKLEPSGPQPGDGIAAEVRKIRHRELTV